MLTHHHEGETRSSPYYGAKGVPAIIKYLYYYLKLADWEKKERLDSLYLDKSIKRSMPSLAKQARKPHIGHRDSRRRHCKFEQST